MTRRLVKVAKELNVGTTTIVDFLVSNGHEIENKPTSKVTEDMYSMLLQEFSNSIAVKEKADKMVIGQRNQEAEEEKPIFKKVEATPPPAEEPIEEKAPEEPVTVEPVAEEEVEEEVIKEEVVDEEITESKEDENLIKATAAKSELKVVGKIDLSPPKKVKSEKTLPKATPEKEIKETPKAKEVKEVESKIAEDTEPAPKAAPVPSELVRAKTPQLQGLKIQGKIDMKKFDKPKKEEKAKPAGKTGPAKGGDTKRKRTRKKVTAQSLMKRDNRRGGQSKKPTKRDEVQIVSKKEIEEKIKATMARISGGGKNKRQKIRRNNRVDKREKEIVKEMENIETKLQLTEFVSASELASLMDVTVAEIITKCMNLGVIISINQRLDAEIIELVASEFDHEVEFISAESQVETEEIEEDDEADLIPRAPIVTVMGHVDHGKTSLLDYIREANVADGEAGGITQHVGAYSVRVGDNKKVTFLDTPGHEAFTAMRARGAKVTDIVVVIIAADDKIMPQTREAISHAQAAGVPIVFAINKIDKDGANPDNIKQELSGMNILVEEWGGKYQSQEISAKTGLNIDSLLEKIMLEAEMLELKANPDRLALGTVVEASLEKGKGYVTKLLVQNGTLKIGDALVAGSYAGKVKAMFNDKGKKVKKAGPTTPIAILGLDGAPQAGEKFRVFEKEQEAKSIATKRSQIEREQTNRASKRISLDEIGRRLALGTFKELNLIVKGDVDGSIEALSDSLIKLSQETVQVNVIHKAVGPIAESDVLLATASDAIIIGFQVRPSAGARNLAEKEGVQVKTYSIIYEVIDEIKKAIEGMLDTIKEEKILGNIEIKETYKISKIGTIAGCFVTDGKVTRDSKIRLIREGIVVYPTKEGVIAELGSLKRYKDDVKEVRAGMECGLTIKNYNDIKQGDIIESYEIVEIKRTLE